MHPLICISNRRELMQTYQRENVQQMTHVIFCNLLHGSFILGESRANQNTGGALSHIARRENWYATGNFGQERF